MIRDLKALTPNAKLVCCADFVWNLGRTFPHAILTVFLISQGCTLLQIAALQSVFMAVAMLTEFPSGMLADIFSRKKIYLISVVTLFLSYLLIGFYSKNFGVLVIAYLLYGLSVSLKSGTLEAEVVIEYGKAGLDIKNYSVASSYVMSISSIAGGLIGSFFYEYLHQSMYYCSLALFLAAFVIASLCSFHESERKTEKETNSEPPSVLKELKTGFGILKSSKILFYILCLYAVAMLFIQPFFQYWQVLYQNSGVSVEYFGIIYVLFQVCNLIGTMLYKKIKMDRRKVYILLAVIPIVFMISCLMEKTVIVILPVTVILFYIFYQHLDVIQKQSAPGKFISSFFSLVGTIENIASVISLFLMAACMEAFPIVNAYMIVFTLFAVLSMIGYRLFSRAAGQADTSACPVDDCREGL